MGPWVVESVAGRPPQIGDHRRPVVRTLTETWCRPVSTERHIRMDRRPSAAMAGVAHGTNAARRSGRARRSSPGGEGRQGEVQVSGSEVSAWPPDVQSIEWAARRLHIGVSTAYRLAAAGTLPGVFKAGGQWRVSVPRFEREVHGEAS